MNYVNLRTPWHASANRLLRNATVRARVSELQAAVSERAAEKAAVDRAGVLAQLKENVDRAMQARPVLDSEEDPTGEYRYEGNVANRALELIGKELGMFKERLDDNQASGPAIELVVMPAGQKLLSAKQPEFPPAREQRSLPPLYQRQEPQAGRSY